MKGNKKEERFKSWATVERNGAVGIDKNSTHRISLNFLRKRVDLWVTAEQS